jgi:nitrogen fixation-related uncharacterized protein
MYFPYLITYMLAGFVISLITFLWALNTGQFREQQRARFLPLQGETGPAPAQPSRFYRVKILILFALACSGLVSTAVVIGLIALQVH